MTEHFGQPRIVYVYGDQTSYGDPVITDGPGETGHKFGQEFEPLSRQRAGHSFKTENVSAQKSGAFPRAQHADILARADSVPAYDPHRIHRDFPMRWQRYIRANFRGLGHVQQVFNVSERTARKWWNGETGANGGHVAIAVAEHPVQAPRMLFAAE